MYIDQAQCMDFIWILNQTSKFVTVQKQKRNIEETITELYIGHY